MSASHIRAVVAIVVAALCLVTPALNASVVGHVIVDPLDVSIALSSGEVAIGKIVRTTVSIRNRSTTTVTQLSGELRADPTGVVVERLSGNGVVTLKGGKSVKAEWTLCGRVPGTYVVLARVTGRLPAGAFASESPAVLLRVVPGSGKAKMC